MAKKIKRQEYLTLLQNFSNLRTGQDQVLWSIIGSFWTANSVLLVSIFSSDKDLILYIGLIVSFIGVSISIIWSDMQNRALNRIEYYEEAIKKIEIKLQIGYDYCIFNHPDSEVNLKFSNKKPARELMRKFSKNSIIFWFISIAIFLILLINEYLLYMLKNYCH